MLGGCRFHFSLCVPHDGFIAFIFSGAFTAPTNQVVCLDKIECLRLDRTSACVTEFTAFWMTKWVGSNTLLAFYDDMVYNIYNYDICEEDNYDRYAA